jgi:hypothetical protein
MKSKKAKGRASRKARERTSAASAIVPEPKTVDRSKHESGGCRICAHEDREAIEREFVNWGNSTRIAKDYGLSRDSIYRHAHALNLFARRAANIKRALDRIIERGEDVEVNASAVVAAIQAYAKINAAGKWVERVEQVTLNDLFDRMNDTELEEYAKTARLPSWFPKDPLATAGDGDEATN